VSRRGLGCGQKVNSMGYNKRRSTANEERMELGEVRWEDEGITIGVSQRWKSGEKTRK
jgi:hypothetical protein